VAKKIDSNLICFKYFYKKTNIMNLLINKNALVCGSSQGIGLASAQYLATMGANICLMGRNEKSLQEAIKSLSIIHDHQFHHYLIADVSDLNQYQKDLEAHLSKISYSYDILINNTGGPPSGPIVKAEIEAFKQAFNNHLLANHINVLALKEAMIKNNFGRIVNIISTSVKQPLPNLGVSNTIRAAVANWSKTLASELAPFGITVNNVLPGATSTQRLEAIINNKANQNQIDASHVADEMINEIPMKRFGKPEEIAAAVGFLASPQASYITGINIPVDGGRTACL
jgi:3-oxoacyl-[acyl-carrier protein] reductase